MKPGDLVTLSAYCLKTTAMWKWKNMVWNQKKPLVGLVIRVKENPHQRPWTTKNEQIHYYIRWMQQGPSSRFGGMSGYFYRNDLKFVKGNK